MSLLRFGPAIAGSHSSMTAEGDNSVLMQKVATEYLADLNIKIKKKTPVRLAKLMFDAHAPGIYHRKGKMGSGTDISFIRDIMNIREQLLFLELAQKIRNCNREQRFELWAQKEQDLVQHAARSVRRKANLGSVL